MRLTAFALVLMTAPGSIALARTVETRVVLTPGRVDLAPASVTMEGFTPTRTPARPRLPERTVTVALHPNTDLKTLELWVKTGPTDVLPGRRELPPNPPLRILAHGQASLSWHGASTVLAGRDLDVYGNDRRAIYPKKIVLRGHVTNRRGLRVLHLRYTPLRYRHGTRELLLDRHTEVRLRYRLATQDRVQPDPQLLPHLRRVVNVAQARDWHRAALADSTTPLGYAIVIPDGLRTKSARLADFVTHKESLGMKVTVVTEKELATIKVGPEAGDAERIRGWLQQNYKPLNLRFVLLIGNPDPGRAGVPMKLTYPMIKHYKYSMKAPSDYYYADLSGNWDLDGDGNVAEYPDDNGDGGVDFTPEVFVGRIPVYDHNVAMLDHILDKTIRYATDKGDRSWRQRVLQPAAMLFYKDQYNQPHFRMDGADMAEAIFDQVVKPAGLGRFTLYETEGVDPSKLSGDASLTTENVINEWKKGYGLVTWFGHGSPNGVYRTIWTAPDNGNGIPDYEEVSSPAFFTYDDAVQLDDTKPAFVFHGSCSNGRPENPDNIAYGLLRHGAVGTIGSSREALIVFETGSDVAAANIFGVERDFAGELLNAKPAGEALYIALETVSEKLGMISWLTKMQLNLYGDPSLTLTNCAADVDCDDGDACNGVEVCQAGQCNAGKATTCIATDPCQEASCDKKTGKCSVAQRPEGEACDDGKFCTTSEVCASGKCVGEPRCAAPGNPCVEARCDETQRTCDVYPLSEGLACHGGTRREGTCVAGLCEPDDSGGCSMVPGTRHPALPISLLLLLGILLLPPALRRLR